MARTAGHQLNLTLPACAESGKSPIGYPFWNATSDLADTAMPGHEQRM